MPLAPLSTRLVRAPGPALRPYVQSLWAVSASVSDGARPRREHVLPTGQMHLVFRIGEGQLRLFSDPAEGAGRLAGGALIGGARDRYYVREVSGGQCSVGVQIGPGGAEALFGFPAEAFTNRHTALD